MKLTKNFSLSEFERAAPVPAELIPNVQKLAENLQRLRDRVGMPIRIHSGFRTPQNNTGVKKSQHLVGKAADIKISGMAPREVYRMVLSMIRSGDMDPGGVGLYPDRFVHYDHRGRNARWRART